MSEIETICSQLCESIDVIMSPKSSVLERNTANQYIETFKCNQNVLLLLNVSLGLLNRTVVYKHFGLQLLEVVIKFYWNSMDANLKQQIKQLIESWFHFNVGSNETEADDWRHLMNGSSRCVVEVVMREWPQNWPKFVSLLLQRESNLSLYCIWQLSEDIGVFFKPDNCQRRREITNEFNSNLSQIYSYISKCLTSSDINLCLTSISTLNVMFEWTQLDTNLLNILMQILFNDFDHQKSIQIKQSICDCLLVCLNRKQVKPNDKNAIQTLFSDHNIALIVSIVRKYMDLNAEDVEHWDLVKRLVLVLSGIGQQVVTLSNANSISIDYWNQCLQLMLSLFDNRNVVLNAISVQFWICFLKNYKQFYSNTLIDSSLQMSLLSLIPHKISRQGFDKSLLGLEFDDIEDFDSFFYKFRAETLDLLRQMTYSDENLCFDFVRDSLNSTLIESNNDKTVWDILAQLSAAVFNKINDKSRFYSESNSLLQSLIDKSNREDPDVISSQLSCVSALTVFLPHISNELLNEIIKRTLILASFAIAGQTKCNRTKEVKNLRRHACSLFIKICQTYPSLLVPLFPSLKAHIDLMSADVDQLSQMEKCALNEGLILISNEFADIEVQKQFIQHLFSSINWIINYNLNSFQFIEDIGLNLNSIEDNSFGQKRANILYVVNLILGVLKRIKSDRKMALIPHLFPLINGLFLLISNLNTIWRPECQQKCNENYKSLVYANITETDKTHVLDNIYTALNNEHISAKSDAYRMQTFIWSLHENCYIALGLAINVLKPQIYDQIYDFKPVLIDSEFLPEWKLRMIVKSFVKPLIANCPQSQPHYEKVVPIVSTLLPFLFNKLNERWNAIKTRTASLSEEGMKDESEPIEAEVVSDQINRLLSKEFIELLNCILNSNKTNDSMDYSNQNNEGLNGKISEFGNYCLSVMPNVIIYPTAKSLSWLDTTISLKTAYLNALLIRKIIADNMIQTESAVYFLFEQLITALSYFGEHEQNQSILLDLMLTLYEGIAIKLGFDSIKLKLSQITGSDVNEWNVFDQKLSQNKVKVVFTDKKKKEFLRKLLRPVIGKNIGQLYKYNSVEIKNLRPIFYTKNRVPNNTTNEDMSLCLLFKDL